MEGGKRCEQCQIWKDLAAFHRRKNKTDGRMKICAECYLANLHEAKRQEEVRRQEWERRERELQQEWERRRAEELERIQVLLPTLLQSTKRCQRCQQEFPTDTRGCLVVASFPLQRTTCRQCDKSLLLEYTAEGLKYECPGHEGGITDFWSGHSEKYCPSCREEQCKQNRQAYPLCPMCGTPTRVGQFLRRYRGYTLDIIRVCCHACIPTFYALSKDEQLSLLGKAMVKAYGETAAIYAIQYDDSFFCHHIGRTKHITRRMAEYRRKWYRPVYASHVLEEVPFGPLSIERESRWMLHALKEGWPIDNFDRLDPNILAEADDPLKQEETRELRVRREEIHALQIQKKRELTEAVTHLDPLTAPFDAIASLLESFTNARDAYIVHWFVTHSGTH